MQGDADDDSKASLMDGSYWKNQNRLVVNLGANRKHMVVRKVKSVYQEYANQQRKHWQSFEVTSTSTKILNSQLALNSASHTLYKLLSIFPSNALQFPT